MNSNYSLKWSRANTQLTTTLLGWIPNFFGQGIRYIFYKKLFKKMGRSVRIHHGVKLNEAKFVEIGNGVVLQSGVNLKLDRPQAIKIGSKVLISQDVSIDCREKSQLTLEDLVHLDTGVNLKVQQSGQIEIGKRTYIGPYTCISGYGQIRIGQNCLIASHSSIYAHNHVFSDPNKTINNQGFTAKGIVIEDDCWIGSGVRIVDGVTIGQGSVVGAGAVVTKDIPPYSVAVGVPAKVISKRTDVG